MRITPTYQPARHFPRIPRPRRFPTAPVSLNLESSPEPPATSAKPAASVIQAEWPDEALSVPGESTPSASTH